jgi:hypothetical protein
MDFIHEMTSPSNDILSKQHDCLFIANGIYTLFLMHMSIMVNAFVGYDEWIKIVAVLFYFKIILFW